MIRRRKQRNKLKRKIDKSIFVCLIYVSTQIIFIVSGNVNINKINQINQI